MISLYSGTPGSGKSLHCAERIYYALLMGHPVVCNFEINTQYVKHAELFNFVDNADLCPQKLLELSQQYFKGKKVKEGSIILVVDECQMMFNARSWDKADRNEWNKFFQLHRHFGYDIILIAQFDRMIDRQIRSLIEYEFVHRKVSNFGFKGQLLSVLMLSKQMFVCVKMWYPLKEKVSSEFFRAKKRYYRLYDTFALLDAT